jgi:hypothetical protein
MGAFRELCQERANIKIITRVVTNNATGWINDSTTSFKKFNSECFYKIS